MGVLRSGVSCILVLGDGERGQVLAEVGGFDGDGWFGSEGRKGGCGSREVGGIGRRGRGAGGPDRVLAVTEEKQTDLTVTNEASPLPQLPVFTPLALHPLLRSSSLLFSNSDFFFSPFKSLFSPRDAL